MIVTFVTSKTLSLSLNERKHRMQLPGIAIMANCIGIYIWENLLADLITLCIFNHTRQVVDFDTVRVCKMFNATIFHFVFFTISTLAKQQLVATKAGIC